MTLACLFVRDYGFSVDQGCPNVLSQDVLITSSSPSEDFKDFCSWLKDVQYSGHSYRPEFLQAPLWHSGLSQVLLRLSYGLMASRLNHFNLDA